MAEYDMGLDFAAAEKAVEESRKPVPVGDYTIQVGQEPEARTGKTGRPGLNWTLSIVGHPEFSGKKLFYYTPMPWTDSAGVFVTSGINFLTDFCKALGTPWTGGKLNTTQMLGKTAKCRIKHEPSDDGKTLYPRIEMFY